MLDELEPLLASDVERALERSTRSRKSVGEALDAMRELARGIFPAILADQGLGAALDAYVLRARLPVTVRIDRAVPRQQVRTASGSNRLLLRHPGLGERGQVCA